MAFSFIEPGGEGARHLWCWVILSFPCHPLPPPNPFRPTVTAVICYTIWLGTTLYSRRPKMW